MFHFANDSINRFIVAFSVFLDGSLLYEKIPNAVETDKTALNNLSPGMKKRNFDEANGNLLFSITYDR